MVQSGLLGRVHVARTRLRGFEILTNVRNVFEAARSLQRVGKHVLASLIFETNSVQAY